MTYLQERSRGTISYDTETYDFRGWARRALKCDRLEDLHETLDPGEDREAARLRMRALMEDAFVEIADLYDDFVRKVVGPHFGHVRSFQRPPVFRVHFPHVGSVSPFHCDRFFNANPDNPLFRRSRNVWVPLVDVDGSNSLWIESASGLGDHAPVKLEVGQALVFDAMFLEHGSVKNQTCVTRVSFELRSLAPPVHDLSHWYGYYVPTAVRSANGAVEGGPDLTLHDDGAVSLGDERARSVAYVRAGSELTVVTDAFQAHVSFTQARADDASSKQFSGTLTRTGGSACAFSGRSAQRSELRMWTAKFGRTALGPAGGPYRRGPVLTVVDPDQILLDDVALIDVRYDPYRAELTWPARANATTGRVRFQRLVAHGPDRFNGLSFFGMLKADGQDVAEQYSGQAR
jgi:hypothetical protein